LNAALGASDWHAFKASAPPAAYPPPGLDALHPIAFMQTDDHRLVNTHYRALTERRLTACALAIRLFQIDHGGSLPPDLHQLIPQYLAAIPVDPMARADALCYRRDVPGGIIYSVGDNGSDDGGSEKSNWPDPDRWRMEDVVVHLKTQPRKPPRARYSEPAYPAAASSP
jgi:hypothetical protein